MKRTIPLLITASCGLIIVLAMFMPQLRFSLSRTTGLDDLVATWFDILAAVAFILGGGNLLKMHLKKVSDRRAGWGYSVVTIVSFLAMLGVGVGKIGVSPAPDQEFYGQTFAPMPDDEFPFVATVVGTIPDRADGEGLPLSVHGQIGQEGDQIKFRGWMLPNQRNDLLEYEDELVWRCAIENLAEAAQPPEELRGKVFDYANHDAVAFTGYMDDGTRDQLLALSESAAWRSAVETMYSGSRYETAVEVGELPQAVDPATFPESVRYDAASKSLVARGPLSAGDRDQVVRQFPMARPLDPAARQRLLTEIESRGTNLNEQQRTSFDKTLESSWTAEQLILALEAAGRAQEVDKTACEMLQELRQAEQQGRVPDIDPKKTVGEDVALTEAQRQAVREFSRNPDMSAKQLTDRLNAPQELTGAQQEALSEFLAQQPTVGERNRELWQAILDRENPLTVEQSDFLLATFRIEQNWTRLVYELFHEAHRTKYPWSGDYRAQGSPFWWLYEYAFKPLTATMFALLAFYVASAAFRAFRAKNIEAILLLSTALIILLGRTFAGVLLTGWIPEQSDYSVLRIENLTVFIMQVFNTAGNRAIMIGIALGIASTSLKILLGIDRSYLGSGEE